MLETDKKKIYFTHGDLHTKNDFRYQFFRKLIRLPFAKRLFSFIHPDFALTIGRALSRSSRQRQIKEKIRLKKKEGMENFARSLLKDYDYVIMGHTHEPCTIPMGKGIYANSGDWLFNHSYIKIINGKLELCRFE